MLKWKGYSTTYTGCDLRRGENCSPAVYADDVTQVLKTFFKSLKAIETKTARSQACIVIHSSEVNSCKIYEVL